MATETMQNRIESIFDKVAKIESTGRKDIDIIKKALGNFDVKEKSVLEVGCGLGDSIIHCAQSGAAYAEGFDLSGESIKIAKSKISDLKNVSFYKASLDEYKTDKRFDIIIGWGIFEYFNDPLGSLKKMCGLLSDKGALLLLISRPIFIKRLSFIPRMLLSKVPIKASLPVTRFITKVLTILGPRLKSTLYTSASRTYTIEQAVLDGLMVPRYRVFNQKLFTDYLNGNGFSVEIFDGVAPSSVCIIARKR